MKKFLVLFLAGITYTAAFARTVENELYFRAMKDEMNRALKELRLPGNERPYYVAYWLSDLYSFSAEAALGEVYARQDNPSPSLRVGSILKIGNDEKNNTGYYNYDRSWRYVNEGSAPASYEGIRQVLWYNSNQLYLEAIEQYKEKEAYRRRKNIKELLPDVVPAPQATYLEEIPAWQQPDRAQLNQWVQKVSAWGKEIPFLEYFNIEAVKTQRNCYYLNSRGGKGQLAYRMYTCWIDAYFRQPDGYPEHLQTQVFLKDFSAPELERAEKEIKKFMEQVKGLYGAPEAEVYVGPVLYKPNAAVRLLKMLLLSDMKNIVPWWNNEADDDRTASVLRKKIGMRVMSPGINLYDRPTLRTYEGIELRTFNAIDNEGVAAEDLTVVSNGKLQQLPLSQRPLDSAKEHKSNGHALLDNEGGREDLSTVFLEADAPLTEDQLKEKLLVRCKELELPYCYIAEGDFFRRVYTQDGHEEWVIGLREQDLSQRSLRDILAVGTDAKLLDRSTVVPSLLVDEIELMPEGRQPPRQPFIAKPQ